MVLNERRDKMEGERRKKMQKGFTLLELIIVIIVVGVLATLATGQYIKIVEKARAAEGAYLLGLLRSAQMRYYSEHDAYAQAVTDLDVTYTTEKYFTVDTTPAGTAAEVAAATRDGGGYILCIGEEGVIGCTNGASITCAEGGYATGDCS